MMHQLCLQAVALKALRTNLTDIDTPVAGLLHLVVHDASYDFCTLSQTLQELSSLKTLSLGTRRDMGSVSCHKLHLAGLQELRSVQLDCLTPDSILLSSGCELHISATGMLTPLKPVIKPRDAKNVLCRTQACADEFLCCLNRGGDAGFS